MRAVIDVKGEPTRERQNLSLIYNKLHAPRHHGAAVPVRCVSRSRDLTDTRVAAGSGWRARRSESMIGSAGVPYAKRLAHQPDVPRPLPHRHDQHRPAPQDHQPHLLVHRPQGPTSSTRGWATWWRFDLVQEPFPRAHEIVAARRGAVVKPSAMP